MTENRVVEFPDQSVNEAGLIVDLDLWIDEFERYFEERIVSEIRSTIEAGLEMAPYILISCAIDFLTTFWVGGDSSGTRYQDFVATFFDGYDAENLYAEIRCRMVHNLTVGQRAIICWDEPDVHKCTTADGTVVLNLEQFFADFLGAKTRYFEALRASPDLVERQIRRFNELGVLCAIDADDVRTWIAAQLHRC